MQIFECGEFDCLNLKTACVLANRKQARWREDVGRAEREGDGRERERERREREMGGREGEVEGERERERADGP